VKIESKGEKSMATVTRRTWLLTVGVAPVAGGLAAWAQGPRRVHAGHALSARERIQQHHLPNVEVITHEGRRVRFYDDLVRDKKVIINFMYAKCDGICVPVTMNLARVQKRLGDRVGRDIFMYSITLNPVETRPRLSASTACSTGCTAAGSS
jgi:protein SCO1/2